MSQALTKSECDRILQLLQREISSISQQPKGSETLKIITELMAASRKIREIRDQASD